MALIEITARRMGGDGDARHESVVEVRALAMTGEEIYATPTDVIQWLEENINVAFVYTPDRTRRFVVGVYRAPSGERMLRTHVQTTWSDHLLTLPEFDVADQRSTALPRGLSAPREPEYVLS